MVQLTRLTAKEADLTDVAALEAASYPADEAASEANIRFRQQNAGAFFLVARSDDDKTEDGVIIGFVNGTLVAGDELEEEAMSTHNPNGATLCIHSVVVDSALRRKGIASAMLKQYVQHICENELQVKRIVLVAKAYLVEFYVKCGFAVTKLSPVVHGKDPWFELVLDCEAARRLPIVQVDSFTTELYQGNPAAVVIMPPAQFKKPSVEKWMQRIAVENNLSETAFTAVHVSMEAVPVDVVEFDLRWFTPATEIVLCGHATLATAFALYGDGIVAPTKMIHFHTLSGVLVCRRDQTFVEMDFPIEPLQPVSVNISQAQIAQILAVDVSGIIAMHQTQWTDILVHMDPATFASMKPDFQLMAALEARAVCVTAEIPDEPNVDFQSRFFPPRLGVNEDPVTGSAHCNLAAYWSPILKKTTMYAKQPCPTRGGYLGVELREAFPGRVFIKGEAVASLRGVLTGGP